MTEPTLGTDSPKIFQALRRFLGVDEVALVAQDYEYARAHGGNTEVQLTREEGVSFNPRMARVLGILVHDLQVRELATLRAALYAAITTTEFLLEDVHTTVELPAVPQELAVTVRKACAGAGDDAIANMLRGVIILDTVRHLHQCHWTPDERAAVVERAKQFVSQLSVQHLPEVLVQKLLRALEMQEERLIADTREQG